MDREFRTKSSYISPGRRRIRYVYLKRNGKAGDEVTYLMLNKKEDSTRPVPVDREEKKKNNKVYFAPSCSTCSDSALQPEVIKNVLEALR